MEEPSFMEIQQAKIVAEAKYKVIVRKCYRRAFMVSSVSFLWIGHNLGDTCMIINTVFNECAKHMETVHYFVWEKVAARSYLLSLSVQKFMDILTKPLSANWFDYLKPKLSVVAHTSINFFNLFA